MGVEHSYIEIGTSLTAFPLVSSLVLSSVVMLLRSNISSVMGKRTDSGTMC